MPEPGIVVSFYDMALQLPFHIDLPANLNDSLFLRLYRTAYVPIGRAWHHDRVLSPFWRLYVNDREGARVVWAGGDYELVPGRVHLIPSGIQFDCRCNVPRVAHFYVHFDLVGLPMPALRGVFDRPAGLKPDAAMKGMLQGLLGGWKPGAEIPGGPLAGTARAKAIVYQAMAMHMEGLGSQMQALLTRWTDGRDPIAPAVRYIEEHPAADLSNQVLSRLCHLSTDHFIRRFKQFTGRPPAKYIVDRRVNLAAQKLMLTSDSIESIAESTGFPDRFYFSRVFKERTLISPGAYRREGRV